MFGKLFTLLAVIAPILAVTGASVEPTPRAALDLPTNGVYNIRNAATGLYWQANTTQAEDSAVTVAALNTSPTANQQWTVYLDGAYGDIQSISRYTFWGGAIPGAVLLSAGTLTGWTFTSVPNTGGGVTICANPAYCVTSPTCVGTTLPLTQVDSSQSPALSTVWIFEPVASLAPPLEESLKKTFVWQH